MIGSSATSLTSCHQAGSPGRLWPGLAAGSSCSALKLKSRRGQAAPDPDLASAAFQILSSGTTTGLPSLQSRTFFSLLSYATAGEDWLYYTPRRLVWRNLQFPGPRAQLLNLILAGGCLCWFCAEQEDQLGELYGRSGATRLHLFVPLLRRLVAQQALLRFPAELQLLVGTDRVPTALRAAVHRQRPSSLAITYSTSQCGPITYLPANRALEQPESVGWPLPNVQVGFMAPPDRDGAAEIVVDKTITLAYPSPLVGWQEHTQSVAALRPGDRLRKLDDGQFLYAGRANDVFLLRGVLVSPHELEAFLEAQPGVLEAVAFGAESSTYGAVPMAVVQLAPGLDPTTTAQQLQRRSRQLFGFRGLYAVHINQEVPRGVGGKPLRRQLAQIYRLNA